MNQNKESAVVDGHASFLVGLVRRGMLHFYWKGKLIIQKMQTQEKRNRVH